MYSWLIKISLIFAPAAFALVGNLKETELIPQSCRILLSAAPTSEDGVHFFVSQSSCSATIIGKTTLLTAAHCFTGVDFESGEVFCPGQAPVKLSGHRKREDFTAREKNKNCDNSKDDIAVVGVETPLDATPLRLPKSSAQVDSLLATKPSCKAYGYGLDENDELGNHDGRSVKLGKWHTRTSILIETLNGVEVSRTETPVFEERNECGDRMMPGSFTNSEGKAEAFYRGGDSGGGLVCTNADGESFLIGVTRGSSTSDKIPAGASVDVATWLSTIRKWKTELENSTPHSSEDSPATH